MKSPYKNPYHPIDPDAKDSLLKREPVLCKLDGYLLHVVEPSCVSIVAERGMGGPSVVKQFLSTRAGRLPFRFVECDVKNHLGKGDSAADFYRALISLLWRRLDDLPATAHCAARRLGNSTSEKLNDLEDDLRTFFRAVRESGPPLLLVLYSFDRLPHCFPFNGLDWSFLREFHNCVDLRIYYLVVSRRPLRYIECLHNLERSLFSTIFLPPYRVSLLSEQEARALMTEPGQLVLNRSPWPDWLAEHILDWGGRNPYCTQYICFKLFECIWNRGEQLNPSDAACIADELGSDLREYFDRLYDNLADDQLINPIVRAVESGLTASQSKEVAELVDLGYFLPEPAREGRYVLFSPLFRDYLVRRGVLHPVSTEPEVETDELPKPSPAVQEILKLESPPRDIQDWLDDFYRYKKHTKSDPFIDRYVMLYLTGCLEGLSDEELTELRRHLYYNYYYYCQQQGDKRSADAIRTTFYTKCKRREKEFQKDFNP